MDLRPRKKSRVSQEPEKAATRSTVPAARGTTHTTMALRSGSKSGMSTEPDEAATSSSVRAPLGTTVGLPEDGVHVRSPMQSLGLAMSSPTHTTMALRSGSKSRMSLEPEVAATRSTVPAPRGTIVGLGGDGVHVRSPMPSLGLAMSSPTHTTMQLRSGRKTQMSTEPEVAATRSTVPAPRGTIVGLRGDGVNVLAAFHSLALAMSSPTRTTMQLRSGRKTQMSHEPEEAANAIPAAAAPSKIMYLGEDGVQVDSPETILGLPNECIQAIFLKLTLSEHFKAGNPVCHRWNEQSEGALTVRLHLVLREPRPVRVEWWAHRFPHYREYWPRLMSDGEINRDGMPWRFVEPVTAKLANITHLTVYKESVDAEYFERLNALLVQYQEKLTSLKVYWIEWNETDIQIVSRTLNLLIGTIGQLPHLTHLELVLNLPTGNYERVQVTIPTSVTFLRLEIKSQPDQKDAWLCNTLAQLAESNPNIRQIYTRFRFENLNQLDQISVQKLTKLGIEMNTWSIDVEARERIFSRLTSIKFLRIDHIYIHNISNKALFAGISALNQLDHVEVELRGAIIRNHGTGVQFAPADSVRKLTAITRCAYTIVAIEPLTTFPNIVTCEVIMNCFNRECNCQLRLKRLFDDTQLEKLIVNGVSIELHHEDQDDDELEDRAT